MRLGFSSHDDARGDSSGSDDVGGDAHSQGDGDSDVSQAHLTLSGDGSFDELLTGTTATTGLLVTNDGLAGATLGSVSGVVAPFALTGGTCTSGLTLAPTDTCSLSVDFAPQTAGVASATLSLAYSGGSTASADFILSGSARLPSACDDLEAGNHDYDALGSGTDAEPHVLCTAAQLVDLMNHSLGWRRSFALGADVDLGDYDETTTPPIRPIGNNALPFTGSFDGRGHTITRLRYHSSSPNVGLFGKAVGTATVISDVHVRGADFTGDNGVGVLVGSAERITVSGCSATGTVATTTTQYDSDSGGLIGRAENGCVVSTSWADVSVSSNRNICGGLVGGMVLGLLVSSYALGDVSCTSDVGGLIGTAHGRVLIADSFALGDVSGVEGVGGFIGVDGDLDMTRVRRSFSGGNVTCTKATLPNFCGPFAGRSGTLDISEQATASDPADCYVAADVVCTAPMGCDNGTPDEVAVIDRDALYSGTLHGLDDWRFDASWVAGDDAPPTLAPVRFEPATFGDCDAHQADAPFAGGAGTVESPYLLCTADQVLNVAASPSKWEGRAYRLMRDVSVGATGSGSFPISDFWGLFDGNGHTISGLSFDGDGLRHTPFMDLISGVVRRLGVVNASATDGDYEVALFAYGVGGAVLDCYAQGVIDWPMGRGAGFVVHPYGYSAVINTYADVVLDVAHGGGFVGDGYNNVANSFVYGAMSTTDAGPFMGSGNVINSYYPEDFCTGCDAPLTYAVPVDTGIDPDYFESAANPPLDRWDFSRVWQESPGGLPTLRPGP